MGIKDFSGNTFDWIYNQLQDGNNKVTPRELIHFINSSKNFQIEKLTIGKNELIEPNILTTKSIIHSIKEVSNTKFEYTIWRCVKCKAVG